jgi:hypothetical protein
MLPLGSPSMEDVEIEEMDEIKDLFRLTAIEIYRHYP